MYETVNGTHVSKRAVNRHHVMFESSRYKDSYGRAFRNLYGLVLPMLVTIHDELHADVMQPIKPCKLLMVDIIQTAKELEVPSYERFHAFIDRFEHLAENSQNLRISDEAGRIAENLQLQDEYISQGIVRPTRMEYAA